MYSGALLNTMNKAERHQERPTTEKLEETSHSQSSVEEINRLRSQREPTRGLPATIAHGETKSTREQPPNYSVSGPRFASVDKRDLSK